MIPVFSRLLMRRRLCAALVRASFQRSFVSRMVIERYQVDAFNRVWDTARKHVPLYQNWQRRYNLPDSVKSLKELENWPILTKKDLQDKEMLRRDDEPLPSHELMTGGSTGEPLHLPAYESDAEAGVSQCIGRAAYGILPGDRTFMLWGHRHLYGKGVGRLKNAFVRYVKDSLLNIVRVSAYDLSASAMHVAYRRFVRARPKFIIGFTPAVLAFVRQNKRCVRDVESVKVVLCTAGPLSASEKAEVEEFFAAKVCMEYGSVECAIMGYTRPSDGHYTMFWDSHLIQAVKDAEGESRCIVTRFSRQYVPLIRYDIGDYLEVSDSDEEDNRRSVLEAISIKGRPSEIVKFACGVSFFGALIGDCVKQVKEVVSSQIAVDEERNGLEIRVTATRLLTEAELALVRNRFELTVSKARLLTIKVVQLEQLQPTAGGKIPRIIRLASL